MNNQWRDHADCMVVWADGTYDNSRICAECHGPSCQYPVHPDRYKEIGTTLTDEIGEDSGMGYWDYMYSNQPLGGKFDFDGELVVKEFYTANPDGLAERDDRSSGITQITHEIAQEAYDQLTPKQKEVWDLVMREQLSGVEAAQRLGITQSSLKDRLNLAKIKFTDYLRSQEHRVSS